MPTSEARVPMETPQRYLTQLCKHFAHRLPVTFGEGAACIAFPSGNCALKAEPDSLVMRVASDAADAVPQLEEVVARHLLRFAFRDPPSIVWAPVAD